MSLRITPSVSRMLSRAPALRPPSAAKGPRVSLGLARHAAAAFAPLPHEASAAPPTPSSPSVARRSSASCDNSAIPRRESFLDQRARLVARPVEAADHPPDFLAL